jgi:hypothetical protein
MATDQEATEMIPAITTTPIKIVLEETEDRVSPLELAEAMVGRPRPWPIHAALSSFLIYFKLYSRLTIRLSS